MRRQTAVLILGVLGFCGCRQQAEEPPPAPPPPPRVFGPNEIRPKLLFVGEWKADQRAFLNVQLEVVRPDIDGPPTLTNAEVNEDFFPTITAVFLKGDDELSRQDFPSERSC